MSIVRVERIRSSAVHRYYITEVLNKILPRDARAHVSPFQPSADLQFSAILRHVYARGLHGSTAAVLVGSKFAVNR